MSEHPKLTLEILSGPLDGHTIVLNSNAEWTRLPGSPLSFPWDDELGEPQAHFARLEDGWQLQAAQGARRGTHILRRAGDDHLPASLETGDILKASHTWLLVKLEE
jgi:hypothetical protein